ncbi:MAG: pyridoxine 5'-phosphate synthase [Proteobacteria bacterium]|nr:pyridoxine 5'-phosphate synthase [Pseudomonadota bacterium]MBU1545393.1 pyridoxine 5'-phosphate synthase [Pseudomonadota bacterium]MBU2618065.1 pyridoxine 5'-phosphate synthase [Pseudomonadota bacterium]
MPVLITIQTASPPNISLHQLRQRAERLMRLCGCAENELSILLIDDPAMAQLNEQYRNKKGPTNVLAFAMQEGEGVQPVADLLGDVIISLDTATREAMADGVTLHQRVTILLIHGLLHLLGFDHERSRAEERSMADREKQLLHQLLIEERRGKVVTLAINVDHVATLRQARGISEPDPVLAAGICELAGAQGIVVHLREDRRHIQDRDVRLLRQTVKTKLNLEMGATEEIIDIALEIKPDMITLVPEKRRELTTEGGLNVAGQKKKLQEVIGRMRKAGIPVSLFIDPDTKQISAAHEVGATFVEIHTGRYCDAATDKLRDREFSLIATAAEEAYEQGLRVNAGHGLNYLNTRRVAALGTIEELSIGHAIMARAIFVGLDQAVREMLALLPAR